MKLSDYEYLRLQARMRVITDAIHDRVHRDDFQGKLNAFDKHFPKEAPDCSDPDEEPWYGVVET